MSLVSSSYSTRASVPQPSSITATRRFSSSSRDTTMPRGARVDGSYLRSQLTTHKHTHTRALQIPDGVVLSLGATPRKSKTLQQAAAIAEFGRELLGTFDDGRRPLDPKIANQIKEIGAISGAN
eukprot:9152072-Pyramimonas_sp.AAC.1